MNNETLIDNFISECEDYAAELIPELVQKVIDELNEDHKDDFPIDEWSFFDEMTVINETVYDDSLDEYLENVYDEDIFDYIDHVIDNVTWEQYHFLKYAYLGYSNELDTDALRRVIREQFNNALFKNADRDKVIEFIYGREEEYDEDYEEEDPDDDTANIEHQVGESELFKEESNIDDSKNDNSKKESNENNNVSATPASDPNNEEVDGELTALGFKIAFGLIERGHTKFGDYCRKMIEHFGDAIRPRLKQYYVGAMYDPVMPDDLLRQMTPYEEIEPFDVYNFDKDPIQEIVPIKTRDDSKLQLSIFDQEEESPITSFKDDINQRVAEWERENGRSIKSLSLDEWLDVMEVIMACPRFELEEMINNIQASRY